MEEVECYSKKTIKTNSYFNNSSLSHMKKIDEEAFESILKHRLILTLTNNQLEITKNSYFGMMLYPKVVDHDSTNNLV